MSKKSNNTNLSSTKLPSFNSLADLKPKNKSKISQKTKHKRKSKANKTKYTDKHSTMTKPKSEAHASGVTIEQRATQALIRGNIVEAKRLFDTYIAANQNHSSATAYSNRGIVNARLGDINNAIEDFKKAVELNPDNAAAYSNLANAYLSIHQNKLADEAIKQSLRLDPNNYNANFNHLTILSRLTKYAEAIAAIDVLFTKFPEKVKTVDPSPFIDIKKQVCDWQNIETLETQAATLIDNDNLKAKWALVHVNNHALDGLRQKQALSTYTKQNFGHLTRQPITPYTDEHHKSKIRVAYVSSDFHQHATMNLMAELFESHDYDRFEWYAISHSINDDSVMRDRAKASFDHFIEINSWTDEQVSQWMREQQIDIAIDLKGHTGSSRLGIFARGCAPVQMTYIGFPGTTGADFMDYIIGDKWVTPFDAQDQFSETILQLPHCYQPNDRHRYLPEQAKLNVNDADYHVNDADYQQWRQDKREAEGLPKDAIVLCCFNNTYKLHPSVFAVWMRLLKAHPKAVLWLLADKPLTETNLRKYASEHGVDAKRIIFAPRAAQKEYLTRYLLADLFVDTLAYNAHTTGSDALWIGLPLVTLAGNSFASRVGASLLDTVGLPELITHSLAEYEQKIDELCREPSKLQEYSQYLRDNRDTSPLFDAKQIARDLEALYLSVL